MTIEEKIDKDLQQFENKRDSIGKEIIQIVEDIKRLMDTMLTGITNELGQQAAETDDVLETCIHDSKRLVNRKGELQNAKEKLVTMLSILGSGN